MVNTEQRDSLDIADLELVGGRLCLDFANTTSRRGSPEPRERLRSYEDLIGWCVRVELFGDSESRRLLDEARARAPEAEQALHRALELREAIYGLAVAAARREPSPPEDLDRLNRVLIEGMGRRRLRAAECGLTWTWAERADGVDWMLWPLAYSAAQLLTSSDAERVGQCGGESCDWLFVDESRNRTRRWCDMRDCGNRAKARRHYHRTRQARDGMTGDDMSGTGEPETPLPDGS